MKFTKGMKGKNARKLLKERNWMKFTKGQKVNEIKWKVESYCREEIE